ncbi:MAG: gamma-glutamyl-phosphate reductase, partial [Anaerolineales bacterium]|nr:gamma-glutamyl-phosphate reductase [Anaerolineales bacterium]
MLEQIGITAKLAARQLARASTAQKNRALNLMAEKLLAESATILAANALDVEQAQAANMEPHLIDRLLLNEKRLAGIAADLRSVAALPDPVGERFDEQILPNGLKLRKQRMPLGVLGVIYESRPNVTADIAGLALKSGNAAILRGG